MVSNDKRNISSSPSDAIRVVSSPRRTNELREALRLEQSRQSRAMNGDTNVQRQILQSRYKGTTCRTPTWRNSVHSTYEHRQSMFEHGQGGVEFANQLTDEPLYENLNRDVTIRTRMALPAPPVPPRHFGDSSDTFSQKNLTKSFENIALDSPERKPLYCPQPSRQIFPSREPPLPVSRDYFTVLPAFENSSEESSQSSDYKMLTSFTQYNDFQLMDPPSYPSMNQSIVYNQVGDCDNPSCSCPACPSKRSFNSGSSKLTFSDESYRKFPESFIDSGSFRAIQPKRMNEDPPSYSASKLPRSEAFAKDYQSSPMFMESNVVHSQPVRKPVMDKAITPISSQCENSNSPRHFKSTNNFCQLEQYMRSISPSSASSELYNIYEMGKNEPRLPPSYSSPHLAVQSPENISPQLPPPRAAPPYGKVVPNRPPPIPPKEPPPYKSSSPLHPNNKKNERSNPVDYHNSKLSVTDVDSHKPTPALRNCSPSAFKFFMEQHMENVIKFPEDRSKRRLQLEAQLDEKSCEDGWNEEKKNEIRRNFNKQESDFLRQKRSKIEVSDFDKIKILGIGAFGEVTLVRSKSNDRIYALKTLRKSNVLKRNQIAHVRAERDMLVEADNEWVVKLYSSFQDKSHLYLLMEYVPGGDLMALLIKKGVFEEHLACFFTGELVLAIEYVHGLGFIHRDIKPDNLLITHDGHLKLTDFGLCTGFRWTHDSQYYLDGRTLQDSMDYNASWVKLMREKCSCCKSNSSGSSPKGTQEQLKTLQRRERRKKHRCFAHSLVGTPNYISPEVLLKKGYTRACDWWSVGVILFEMVCGHPPFYADSPADIQNKIINWRSHLNIVPIDHSVSEHCQDLIAKLCQDAEHRLGANRAEDVKSHPFFAKLDFHNLRQLKSPHIPAITSPTDTSNFDPVDPHVRTNMSDDDSNDEWNNTLHHPEHAFFEFTYRRFGSRFQNNGPSFSDFTGPQLKDDVSPHRQTQSLENISQQPVNV